MGALLELEQVSKRYGALVVTDELSLTVGETEALGVLGPNGAGKTTLFNLITGDTAPNAGRIMFGGREITALPPHQRCRMGIGRSYQIPHPFSKMTVFENLVVAAIYGGDETERESYRHCADLLALTGLESRSNAVAGSLTLLQRKQLELARALATKPRLLLLDEIGGGLTEHECQELIETIRGIRKSGIAIVWIEHIVHALLAVVGRLIVVNFGAKLDDGEPRRVMENPAVQDVYMGISAE